MVVCFSFDLCKIPSFPQGRCLIFDKPPVNLKNLGSVSVEPRVLVFFSAPDIWNHLASKEHVNVYKQIKREEVEVEEEVEVDIEVEEEGEAKEGVGTERRFCLDTLGVGRKGF